MTKEVENIPDEDFLYYRVHNNFLRDCKIGEIPAGAIKNTGSCKPPGMSTDWSNYSTPDQTKNRGKQDPDNYKIISIPVGAVRNIPNQSVTHSPAKSNHAHTTIFGPKDPEIRIKFTRIAVLL